MLRDIPVQKSNWLSDEDRFPGDSAEKIEHAAEHVGIVRRKDAVREREEKNTGAEIKIVMEIQRRAFSSRSAVMDVIFLRGELTSPPQKA